jgi:hypothetical protein
MKLKTKVHAGSIRPPGDGLNHNARRLVVKSKVRGGLNGGWDANNNARKMRGKIVVKTKVRAGATSYQHNARKPVAR